MHNVIVGATGVEETFRSGLEDLVDRHRVPRPERGVVVVSTVADHG